MPFTSIERELRAAIIATATAMNAAGINRGKSGNVSARSSVDGIDGFLITPTGLAYDATTPGDIVAMTIDGTAHGGRHPSSPRTP